MALLYKDGNGNINNLIPDANQIDDQKESATTTYSSEKINTIADGKVDVVEGKGLSTNDYTTTEKNNLASIVSTLGADVEMAQTTDVDALFS